MIAQLLGYFIWPLSRRERYRKKYIEQGEPLNIGDKIYTMWRSMVVGVLNVGKVPRVRAYLRRIAARSAERAQPSVHLPDADCSVSPLICHALRELGECYYFPNYGNLGDVLIAHAQFQLLDSLGIAYEVYDGTREMESPFNLVYGGGGLWIPNWDYSRQLEVLKSPHLQKCVILASSMNDCDDLLGILDERFVVFLRERKSYQYCLESSSRAIFHCVDDMVFHTDMRFYRVPTIRDADMVWTSSRKRHLQTMIHHLDSHVIQKLYREKYLPYAIVYKKMVALPSGLIHLSGGRQLAYVMRCDSEKSAFLEKSGIKSTLDLSLCGISSSCDPVEVRLFALLFFASLDCVDIIVTDRLHVAIAGSLLNKQVLMLDNNYGKLSNVYQNSMMHMEHVQFVQDPSELPAVLANCEQNLQGHSTSSDKIFRKCKLSFAEYVLCYLMDVSKSVEASCTVEGRLE